MIEAIICVVGLVVSALVYINEVEWDRALKEIEFENKMIEWGLDDNAE